MWPKFQVLGEMFYTYPLILGLIWAVGFEYSRALNTKLKNFNLLFLSLFIFSWLGAKVLFLITLDEVQAKQIAQASNFWLGGGFVFLGGLIGGLSVILLHKIFKNQKISDYEFMLLPLTLGHSMGRIACFFAGCCYGTFCELPWSVHMHGAFRHPVQLYEASILVGIFLFLRKRFQNHKSIFLPYLSLYFVSRFFLEFIRGDKIRGIFWFGLSTSQIISLIGLIIVIAVMMLRKRVELKRI